MVLGYPIIYYIVHLDIPQIIKKFKIALCDDSCMLVADMTIKVNDKVMKC